VNIEMSQPENGYFPEAFSIIAPLLKKIGVVEVDNRAAFQSREYFKVVTEHINVMACLCPLNKFYLVSRN
jgi:hypothetical protein